MLKKILYLILFLLLSGLFYVAHFEVPRFIVEIKHPIIEQGMDAYRPKLTYSFKDKQPNGKFISVVSSDGTEISGFLSPSNTGKQKGTIILLHGIRSQKEQWIESIQGISGQGWNCVALDLRAHGQSSGKYCTFGVKEKEDISAVIDFLYKEQGLSQNIGIWGSSLGGAIALQCLSNDERIKFGIIESTFSEFRTVTKDYMTRTLGFSSDFLGNYLVDRAGKLADFDPEAASPINVVDEVQQPVLVFHGTADENISITYGKANFDGIASKDKKWVEIKGGAHNGMANADSDLYFKELNTFFNKVAH